MNIGVPFLQELVAVMEAVSHVAVRQGCESSSALLSGIADLSTKASRELLQISQTSHVTHNNSYRYHRYLLSETVGQTVVVLNDFAVNVSHRSARGVC